MVTLELDYFKTRLKHLW